MAAMPNQLMIERLQAVARDAAAAVHGQRGAIYEAAAKEMNISLATLHRQLKAVTARPQRKRRADAGRCSLTRDEGLMIAAYLMESTRRNGKRLAKVETAVEILRANGRIVAGRTNEEGKFIPLSISAIRRSLYAMGLHPDQLMQPAPKQQLASDHPNHVWQADPSLCVLYYLHGQSGLNAMPADEFYKNKPANLARISNDRVWRYVFTDHASGAFYVEYVMGAESGANLSSTFINAIQNRGPQDPFYGVPKMIMLDPGSANTGAVFRNLCLALGVEIQINKPGQPWAKGQVEQANNLIECEFEQGLRFLRIETLEQLNQECWRWMKYFNAKRIHTRTNMTRYEGWLHIRQDQLRIAPPVDVCRDLAYTAPEERLVSPFLRVSYRGREFDVSNIPGVMVGEKLLVTRNAFADSSSAQIVLINEEGHQVFHAVDAVNLNQFGFAEGSPTIGRSYKAHGMTPAQHAAAEVEQLVMGASNADDAKAKRKAKELPFGGEIDPYKPVADADLPTFMPRRGTAMDIPTTRIEAVPLTHFAAAKLLKPMVGDLWTADSFAWLQSQYPDGIREGELDAVAERFKSDARPGLRAIGGA